MVRQRGDYLQNYRIEFRKKILQKINRHLKCERCNCDDWRFLEINHKDGYGEKDRRVFGRGASFLSKINCGQRSTDDLELLCRPCNAIHYLELKYKRPLPMQVVWRPER